MNDGTTPASVEGLYEQLACQRAGQARALLARQVSGERLFTESAAALEEAETIDGLRTCGYGAAVGRVAQTLLTTNVNRLPD